MQFHLLSTNGATGEIKQRSNSVSIMICKGMLYVVSLKRLTFTTSPLVQLVPVAPLESPLSRLEQVASIGQPSNTLPLLCSFV